MIYFQVTQSPSSDDTDHSRLKSAISSDIDSEIVQ